jgi:hypothetical protein
LRGRDRHQDPERDHDREDQEHQRLCDDRGPGGYSLDDQRRDQ